MENRIEGKELKSEKDKLLGSIWAYTHLGMYKEAFIDCENLIALSGDDPLSYKERALSYEDDNQIEKAIACYYAIINRFPDYHVAYTNLGHLFQEHKKRLDMAMVCYEKALELNPEDFWALHNIGTVLKKRQNMKEAYCYFKKAYEIIRIKGDFERKIVYNFAWALYRCAEFENARRLYEQLTKVYPDDGLIHFELGCVNYRMGRYKDAVLQLEEALFCQPDNRFYQHSHSIAIRKASISRLGALD